MSKGISPIISYVMYVAIGIGAVTLMISIASPQLKTMRETASVQNQINELSSLGEEINALRSYGEGTQSTFNLRLRRGELYLEDNTIYYELESKTSIISPGTVKDIGQVTLSADANVKVRNASYNGIDCYLMQNRYMETCIRSTDRSFTTMDLQDAVLYLKHRRVEGDPTITPTLNLSINGDEQYRSGQVKVVPRTIGDNIGTGRIELLVKPPDRPSYRVTVALRSRADFFQISAK